MNTSGYGAYDVSLSCKSISSSITCTGANDSLVGTNGKDQVLYYKCSTAVSTSACGSYDGMKITFTSRASGSGTASSPYVLNGCAFSGTCVCKHTSRWTSSGCSACNGSSTGLFMAVTTTALNSGRGAFHTNGTCQYCPDDYYFEMGYCNRCPSSGYSLSPTQSQGKTACYQKAGSTFSDTKGSGTCGGAMYWVN